MKFECTALLLALTLPNLPVQAQAFPDRPVQMIVPFGPGGTTDIMARLLQEELGRALGTTVVVINTAGAGGAIGMAQAARAKPDGHTIAMTTVGPQVIQPARRNNTGYTADSFDYLCGTYDVPLLTMVRADSPHKTLDDLVAWARANPAKYNYGSSGIATSLHIAMLQLNKHYGVAGTHVPYRSTGDMIVPLKNGEIEALNETPPVATQHGLRPLMVLADVAPAGFEAVPTAKQAGIPVRGTVWGGLVAPKGLPAEVRQKIEAACQRATASASYQARAAAAHSPLVYRDGAAFRQFAMGEAEKYARVVRDNGLEER